MPQEKPTPLTYFAALQEMLKIQTDVLTRVLPHSGERGDNDDEHFKTFLRRVLPHRYSIGTGFMVSSNPSVPRSAQTDIVIYDEFNNSPLYRELSASVFPVEIVYAAIEVKRNLQSKDLNPAVENIAKVRTLAKEKWYVKYGPQKVSGADKPALVEIEYQDTLAPRTFVVAYDTQYATADSLRDAWMAALSRNLNAHLHGCLVLKKNWFFSQLAFLPEPVVVSETDDALVRFLSFLLTSISSMPVALANLKRYFDVSGIFSSLDTDPQEDNSE
jgi:hypothetical protein